MKRLLINTCLLLTLSVGIAYGIAEQSSAEAQLIWQNVSQSQMSFVLPANTTIKTQGDWMAFLAADPERSIQIRGFQFTNTPDGGKIDVEYTKPHLDKLQLQLPSLSVDMNLPAAARAELVLKALEPLKTNTNADIIHLRKLLLDANIPSRYRVSEHDNRLHYSLIANIDGVQYNVDLANWMVSDGIMIQQGFQFKYDNSHLTPVTPTTPIKPGHKPGFAYYSQTDKAWKLKKFSYSNIMRTGCGPVSAAMIFNYLTPEGTVVSPPVVIQLARAHQLDIDATPRVHMPKLLTQLSQQYKVPYKTLKTFDERYLPDSKLGLKVANAAVKAQVTSEIKSGKIVLIATLLNSDIRYTSGTEHFLVVKDFVNGKAIVYDPLPKHTYYEPLPANLQQIYGGYCYQVPIDLLLKRMTQAYSFEQ